MAALKSYVKLFCLEISLHLQITVYAKLFHAWISWQTLQGADAQVIDGSLVFGFLEDLAGIKFANRRECQLAKKTRTLITKKN